MTTTLNDHLDRLRSSFNLDVYIRHAQLVALHAQWVGEVEETEHAWHDRADTILSERDAFLIRRHILTDTDRAAVREALAKIPRGLRAELDLQDDRLGRVQSELGAEPRRRIAEIRCWLHDSMRHIDALEFYEARKLLADAVHQLEFMLDHLPQNDRPSRNRLEFDRMLRERVRTVASDLRRHVRVLA